MCTIIDEENDRELSDTQKTLNEKNYRSNQIFSGETNSPCFPVRESDEDKKK